MKNKSLIIVNVFDDKMEKNAKRQQFNERNQNTTQKMYGNIYGDVLLFAYIRIKLLQLTLNGFFIGHQPIVKYKANFNVVKSIKFFFYFFKNNCLLKNYLFM